MNFLFQRTCSQWYIQQYKIFTSEVFQICTFSIDLKRTSKAIRTVIVFDQSYRIQSANESQPTGRPNIHYFVKENSSEYLHEFSYDYFSLVKEECCADEKNTYWACYNDFFELASILTEESILYEANSPEEAFLLFQDLYQLILLIWDISFIYYIHHFPFIFPHM